MNHQANQMKQEYYRNWRAAHKDKVREYNNRYWEKKAAEAAKQEDKQQNG